MNPNRRTAREVAMKALYALDLSHDSLEHVIDTVIRPVLKKDQKLFDFAESLFIKAVRDAKEVDEIIVSLTDNWDIKRIALVDKMIMRLAIIEMMQFSDIPTKVTINEAIEIAKSYSTEKSGKFINGILDTAAGKLADEKKIVKTGTGLLEAPLSKPGKRKEKAD
jgi:N utilization substance protein B